MKRLWGNKWSMSWRPIPFGKYLIEKPCGDICHEKNPTKISCPKAIFWGGNPPRHRIYFEDTLWKVRYQTICEGQLSTKQTSNGNIFQTNSKGNLYQRLFGKACLPKKPKEKSLRKKSEEKTLPPQKIKQSLYQQLCQKVLPRKLWRDIPCKIKIWKKIYQNICLKRHFPTKQIEETSLRKEHLKRNLYQKVEETSPPKNLRKET